MHPNEQQSKKSEIHEDDDYASDFTVPTGKNLNEKRKQQKKNE